MPAPRAPTLTAILSLALTTSLAGCGGWRGHGDTFYGSKGSGSSSPRQPTYGFAAPGQGWSPISANQVHGVQVAWHNRGLAAFIELHALCADQGDSSLDQYTDHLRIDWTHWKVVEQTQGELLGRAALHTVVDAELDGKARRNEYWVVKKNGCLFDLRYSAKPAGFDRGAPAFSRVVQSFQFPL